MWLQKHWETIRKGRKILWHLAVSRFLCYVWRHQYFCHRFSWITSFILPEAKWILNKFVCYCRRRRNFSKKIKVYQTTSLNVHLSPGKKNIISTHTHTHTHTHSCYLSSFHNSKDNFQQTDEFLWHSWNSYLHLVHHVKEMSRLETERERRALMSGLFLTCSCSRISVRTHLSFNLSMFRGLHHSDGYLTLKLAFRI